MVVPGSEDWEAEMDKGYAVECSVREYATRWGVDQCVGFLSRWNAFDTYEYAYVCGEKPTITFLWKSNGGLHRERKSLNARYRISFRKMDEGTSVRISYWAHPMGMKMTDVELDGFFSHQAGCGSVLKKGGMGMRLCIDVPPCRV